MDSDHESQDKKSQVIRLNPETELRLIVDSNEKLILELQSGTAEIHGSELLLSKKYVFRRKAKVNIFTWHGCKFLLRGKTSSAEVVRETPMVIYANVHAAIEQMRQIAEEKRKKGPSVLVIGPSDVGKSTLCKLLLNYAVRQNRQPIFIDLDVGQGQISIPGTMCALRLDKTADIEEGFSQQVPLVYHYGLKSPGHDIKLYNRIIAHIAENMNTRARQNVAASSSGIIINTCGWVKSDGYQAITQAVLEFEIDVVLVLGMESLYYQIVRDVPNFVKAVFLPRFNVAIERSRAERIQERDDRVYEYFYGGITPLKPHTFTVKFDDVRVYKIAEYERNDPAAPPGTKFLNHGFCLVPVHIGYNLLNHILSVTYCTDLDENVMYMSLAGFICVTRVDTSLLELTIISPQPPPLPNVVLLYCDIIYDKDLC